MAVTVHTGSGIHEAPFHTVPDGHAHVVVGVQGPQTGVTELAQKVRVSVSVLICPPGHASAPPGPITRVSFCGSQVSVMGVHGTVVDPADPHGPQKPAGWLLGGM